MLGQLWKLLHRKGNTVINENIVHGRICCLHANRVDSVSFNQFRVPTMLMGLEWGVGPSGVKGGGQE